MKNTMKNTKIIAVANQKGGVAKTTSTLNIGVSLRRLNKKVLLIDGDPQSSLSKAYWHIQDTDEIIGMTELMTAAMQRKPFDVKTAIRHDDLNDIDYIPANISLSGVETQLVNARLRESIMQRALQDTFIIGKYDYVIIDCPPSLSTLLYNELTAADEVIIPVEPEDLSIKGIELLLDTIADVQEFTNDKLHVLGFMITKMSARANLHKKNVCLLGETFDDIDIIGTIHRTIKVAESVSSAKALLLYPDNEANEQFNKTAYEYKNIAKRIVRRTKLCEVNDNDN